MKTIMERREIMAHNGFCVAIHSAKFFWDITKMQIAG